MRFKICSYLSQGKRENQEDSIFILKSEDESKLAITVCDGLGGHSNGKLASSYMSENMTRKFVELNPLNSEENDSLLRSYLLDNEEAYFNAAPHAATTLVSFLIDFDKGNGVGFYAGDSHLILIRDEETTLRSNIEANYYGAITNCLNAQDFIDRRSRRKRNFSEIHQTDSFQIKSGDILILASDGLDYFLSEKNRLANNRASDEPLLIQFFEEIRSSLRSGLIPNLDPLIEKINDERQDNIAIIALEIL